MKKLKHQNNLNIFVPAAMVSGRLFAYIYPGSRDASQMGATMITASSNRWPSMADFAIEGNKR